MEYRQMCLGMLFLAMFVIGTNGGFPGIFCGSKNKAGALASCNGDCRTAHNAVSGKCGIGKDYNCYCDGPLPTVNNRSVQCLDPKEPKWAEVCTIDCRCDHGALGGWCDYRRHGCTCFGVAAGFRENRCPFKTGDQLLTWFNESYTAVGMSQFAAALLAGKFGDSKKDATLHTVLN